MAGRVLTIEIKVTGGANQSIQNLVTALNDLSAAQNKNARATTAAAAAQKQSAEGVAQILRAYREMTAEGKKSKKAQEEIAETTKRVVEANERVRSLAQPWAAWTQAINAATEAHRRGTAAAVQQVATANAVAASARTVTAALVQQGQAGMAAVGVATKTSHYVNAASTAYSGWAQVINTVTTANKNATAAAQTQVAGMQQSAHWAGVLRGALVAQGQAGMAAAQAAVQSAASHKSFAQVMTQAASAVKNFVVNLVTGKSAQGAFVVGLNAAATQGLKLTAAIDQARRSAYALTIAGAQTKAIFNQISDALGGTIDKLTEFDYNLRRAAGATQIFDDTSEAFRKVEQEAKNLAVTTKMFTGSEIAKGMYFWASSTGEAADATNELIPVLKMAAMTDTAYETSIKGVVNILQQFGEPMTEAQRVTEELFQVTQKTALEFPNLIESFKMVGPVAANFGVSVGEMMKLFGILGDVGIKGSMAGRAMAMMFAQIADPTDKATNALNKYAEAAGMIAKNGNFWDLVWPEGKFVGVQGFLNLLTQMTRNLNEEEKNALLAAITTQNEWRALAPLLDANTRSIIESGKGIVETTDVMDGAAESFAGAWEMMAKSVKATFMELQNRLDNLIMSFGRALMEVLQPILQKLNEIAAALQLWADANPELMKLVAGITLVVAAFFALTSVILMASGYFILLKNVALPTLGLITGHFTTLTTVAEASGTFIQMFSGMLTHLVTRVPQVMALTAIFTVLAGVVSGLASEVGPAFVRLLQKVAEVIGKLAVGTVAVLGGLFKFGEEIGKRIAPAVAQLIDVLVIVIDSLDAFMGWLGEIINTLARDTNIQAFVDQMAELVEILGSAVWSTLSAFIEGLAWMAKTAAFWVGKLAEALNIGGGGPVGGPSSYGPNELLVNTGTSNDAAARKKLEYSGPTQYPGGAMAMGIPIPVSTGNEAQDLMAIRDAWDQYTAAVENSNKVTIQRHALSERTDAINAAEAASVEATTTAVSAAFTKFNAMVTDALKNLSSGNREAAVAAYNTVRTYAATMIERAPSEVPPAVKALFTAAQSAVKSNTAAGRVTGKQITAIIAEGFRSGHTELILPRIAEMMKGIRDKIKSNNPAMQKEGRDSLVALAQGLSTSGLVDTAAQNQLGNAINALQSANPDMWQSGYDWIMEVVNGVGGGYPALVKAMQAVARTARRYGENISEFVKNPLGEGNKPPVDTFKPEPLDTGGGGGGGTEQSPLEKALEVAKNAADLAEALAKIKGLNIKKLVQEAMGPIAEAMVLAERITYRYAKGFSKEHLQKVADFSDAMSKMVGFINGAFDAFTKAKDFKAVSSTVLNKLFDAVQYSVVQMEKIAKKLTGTKGRDSLLAQTAIFAESANSIVSTIGSAFEAFAKVPKEFTAPPKQLLDDVSKAIGDAVKSMEQVAKDTDTTLLNAAKDFAEAAKSVMDAIGTGLDLFSKRFDTIRVPTPDDMKRIVAGIKLAVSTLVTEVRAFNEEFKVTYGEGGEMGVFREFAETAKAIMDAIQQAFTMFQPQEYREMGPGLKNPFMVLEELVDQMVRVIQVTNDKFASIKLTMTVQQIKDLIDVAKGVMDAIQAFFGLASNVTTGTGEQAQIQTLIDASLTKIMALVSEFIGSFEQQGADLVANFAKGLESPNAIRQLEDALGRLQDKITSSLSGMGTLTITWNSGGGGMSAAAETPSGGGGGGGGGGGVSASNNKGVQSGASQYASGGPGNPYGDSQYWTDANGVEHWSVGGVTDPIVTVTGVDQDGNPTGYSYTDPATGKAISGSGKIAGGSIYPGQSVVVGEGGPEVVHMNEGSGATVMPVHDGGVGGINTTKQYGGLGVGGSSVPGSGISMGTLNVNVTSADKSVSSLDLTTLSKFISDQLRSNLQHSASVK